MDTGRLLMGLLLDPMAVLRSCCEAHVPSSADLVPIIASNSLPLGLLSLSDTQRREGISSSSKHGICNSAGGDPALRSVAKALQGHGVSA
jgi:hypothetical protein